MARRMEGNGESERRARRVAVQDEPRLLAPQISPTDIPAIRADTASALTRAAARVATGIAQLERVVGGLAGLAGLADVAGVADVADVAGERDEWWSDPADLGRRIQALRAELRRVIALNVARLRDAGEPPERVLVLVKSTVGAAARTHLPSREAEQLVTQSSQWVIDSYFPAA